MSEAYYEGMTLEQRARVAFWALAPMAARGDLERPADQDVLDDLFEVGDVEVSEDGPLTDEDYRALIRACLRELEEPNAATTALECLEAAADEIEATGTDQAMNSNATGWRDQLVKDIRYAAEELRSLLPETEGEA